MKFYLTLALLYVLCWFTILIYWVVKVVRINPLSNPFLFYSMVAAFLAQIAVVYVPALQWVFKTEALNGMEWVKIMLVAITVVVAVEVDKAIRRRRKVSRSSS